MKWNLIRLCAALLILFALLFEPTLRLAHVFLNRTQDKCEVLIDPGHGGIDGGAIGKNGTVEKGINLSISKKLSALMGLYGVSNQLTRDDDSLLSTWQKGTIRGRKNADLSARAKMANAMEDASFISVHLNSYPDESCHGAQVFYSKNQEDSEKLAKLLQTELVNRLDDGNHRVAKAAERGHYLLQHIQKPAVLVECGFLSNSREEALLASEDYQLKLATCIIGGYLKYRKQ